MHRLIGNIEATLFRVLPRQVFPQLPLEQPRYDEREARRLSVQREHPNVLHNLPSQQGYPHNENQQNNHQNYQNQQNKGQNAEIREMLHRTSETRDGVRAENRGAKQGKEDDREMARRGRQEWERLEWERAEKEREERSRNNREREKAERLERDRMERDRAERERIERERKEKDRVEKEREERERLERVRAAREREERVMMEQLEEERAERQRAERQSTSLGPRPSPLGEDSPPVGKNHTFGLHKVSFVCLDLFLFITGAHLASTSGGESGGKAGNRSKKGGLR